MWFVTMPNTIIGSTARMGCSTGCNRRQCCRTTLAFLFSHIGLTALVVGYSVMGAFLFQHLEQDYETKKANMGAVLFQQLEQEYEMRKVNMINLWKEEAVGNIWTVTTDMHIERALQDHCTTSCEPARNRPAAQRQTSPLPIHAVNVSDRITELKTKMIDSLWNFTLELNVLWKENWTALADNHVTGFLHEAHDLLEAERAGSAPSAAPQIQCSTTCEVSMNLTKEMKHNWTTAVNSTLNLFQDNITNMTLNVNGSETQKAGVTKWTFSSSFIYALSVITTIGYSHVTPKTTEGKIATVLYAVIGIPIMLLFLANIGDFLARIFRGIFSYISRWRMNRDSRPKSPSRRGTSARRSQERANRKRRPRLRNVGHNAPADVPPIASTWDTDDEIMELPVEKGTTKTGNSVPILGCLVIMGTYLFGGATLFSLWERWQYLDAFYFCFVTLTTIGFGDFIPGAMPSNDTSSPKLVVCCIYVLVGLSLIACCFNLMQEQVRWYAATLARLLGFAQETKEEETVVIQTERVDIDA